MTGITAATEPSKAQEERQLHGILSHLISLNNSFIFEDIAEEFLFYLDLIEICGHRHAAAFLRRELEIRIPINIKSYTNDQLLNDVKELSHLGKPLSFEPSDQKLGEEVQDRDILDCLKSKLGLGLEDYKADIKDQLIVACGIASWQLGQLIVDNQSDPLYVYAWKVLILYTESPNKRRLANQPQPISPPDGPPPPQPSTWSGIPKSLEAQDPELVVIAINMISFQCCFQHAAKSFCSAVAAVKLGLLNCAANARDDIYLQMGARPRNRESSKVQLQADLDELLQVRQTPQGTLFSALKSKTQPDWTLNGETVLRGLNHSLGLQIVDYNADLEEKLIAACSIGLSQLGRVITYDPTSSLVSNCWLVQDILERFPRSRCLALLRPINQPVPPFTQSPQESAISDILIRLERLEEDIEDLKKDQRDQDVKNNLNLSVRVDNPDDGQFKQVTNHLSDIAQKLGGISYGFRTSNKGPDGPPCTPANRTSVELNTDDGQNVSIDNMAQVGFQESQVPITSDGHLNSIESTTQQQAKLD
ncbi:hypothetical protein IL306_001464 [Fusarium sp. DS 682]|nr:hypothetical protein IL306_001464 [Fusarium sp. DS 682]